MKLLLSGGGSGKQTELTNKKLNEIIDHSKPVLYIPLAMDESEHSYDSCYEWIKGELSFIDIPFIEMVRTFDELKDKKLFNYSCIFIGGGNTYKLLKGIKENGIFERLREYINSNGIVIGGSAGAVIFGKDIDIIACMDEKIVELADTSGFNCVKGLSIMPHYTNKRSKFTEKENEERHIRFTNFMKEFSKVKGDVIAIPEEDTIYVDDNNIEIIGTLPYYISHNGIITKYEIETNEMQNQIIKN